MSPLDPDIQTTAKRYDVDAAFLQAVVEATVTRLGGESRETVPTTSIAGMTAQLSELGQRLEALIAQQQRLVDALRTREVRCEVADVAMKVRSLSNVTMTVTVTETHAFRIRRFVALNLIRLAGLFLGCRVEVVAAALLLLLMASPLSAQTCPGFPARGVQIIDALYNPALANGTDDDRRQLTRTILEQLAFEMPADGWTWKSADPGRPPSKDSLSRLINGRLCNWDWQSGATRQRAVQAGTLGEDITGQNPIPVARTNHLGDAPEPLPPTPGPSAPPVIVQAPPVDLGPVLANHAETREHIERTYLDLVARLEELRTKNDALAAQLKQHDENPSWMSKVFGSRYTQIVMGAAAAWFTAQQTAK